MSDDPIGHAGYPEWKARADSAEKRLAEAERVRDELGEQLQITRQAEKERRFERDTARAEAAERTLEVKMEDYNDLDSQLHDTLKRESDLEAKLAEAREWNATYKNRIADLEAKLDRVRVDGDALRSLVFKYAHDLNFTFDERERIFMECTNYEFDNGGGSSDIVYSTAQRKNFRRLREALVEKP